MFDLRLVPKITVSLIVISVLVAIWSGIGARIEMLYPLLLTLYKVPPLNVVLPEVMSGQVWRLVTPIFIHFGILHIAFNSVMTYQLGGIVEAHKGMRHMVVFVLVAAIIPNLAQYIATGNPLFGGLSGVVYAMFGYIWMQSLFNPTVNIPLQQQFVLIILGWFALCWLGVIPDVANWAHTGGLLLGIIWGFCIAKLDYRRVARR